MNDKNIFDALRDIDPQWILDAAPQKRTHSARTWIKWGSLAACFCLVVAAIIGAVLWLRPDDSVSPEPTLPPHNHVFGEWHITKDATCSENGEETRLCACGEKETKIVALLPHFAGAWVVEKEPTIKIPTPDDPDAREPGLKCQFCDRCGAKLNEELIPATGSVGLAYAINPDGKTFSVAGIGNCTDADVIVPENFCGYHVTSIMAGAFEKCETLKSITLPETVTVIGERAFRWCNSFEKITLPDTLETIGAKAFYNCNALKSVNIPQSVTSIGEGAFGSCYNLTSVVVPNQITVLAANVFDYCISLETIVLPDSLQSIGESVFSSCIRLKNITIPSGVTSIGNHAFFNCNGLVSIVLPDGVETIQTYSFGYCTRLEHITLPQGVKNIEAYAFSQCSTLKSIDIPVGVTTISNCAFLGCRELETVNLPQGIKQIGALAFSGCKSLCNIGLPDGVTFIDHGAFAECESLQSLSIPDSVTHIGSDAFEECVGLLQEENGVFYVGKWAVDADKEREEVVLRSDTVGLAENLFFASNTLVRVTLPNSLQYICKQALAYGWELREILFDGTPEEWEAIQKAENWDQYSNLYKLIFTKESDA